MCSVNMVHEPSPKVTSSCVKDIQNWTACTFCIRYTVHNRNRNFPNNKNLCWARITRSINNQICRICFTRTFIFLFVSVWPRNIPMNTLHGPHTTSSRWGCAVSLQKPKTASFSSRFRIRPRNRRFHRVYWQDNDPHPPFTGPVSQVSIDLW